MQTVLGSIALATLLCGLLSGCATAPAGPANAAARTFALERDLLGSPVAHGEFRAITGTGRVAQGAALNNAAVAWLGLRVASAPLMITREQAGAEPPAHPRAL
jgi:CelD/BcsL family acetyltransferase involved in cellulose biosynthesis